MRTLRGTAVSVRFGPVADIGMAAAFTSERRDTDGRSHTSAPC